MCFYRRPLQKDYATVPYFGYNSTKKAYCLQKDDGSLHYEQLFGTIGFDGMSSLMYHLHRPTQVKEVGKTLDVSPRAVVEHNIKSRLMKGFEVEAEDDYLDSRKTLLFNSDVHIGLAVPRKSMTTYFYKNTDADELIFVHRGAGTLKTILRGFPFEYGDYMLIPRGTIYQIVFDSEDNRLLIIESYHSIYSQTLP